MNEVLQTIRNRRTIRRYTSDPIPEGTLDRILEAGLWAPSAGGKQSCHILVSEKRDTNERIGQINRNFFPNVGKGGHDVNEKQLSIAEDAALTSGFYGAPVVLMLFSPTDGGYSAQNCMAVAENMLLAAAACGLGSAFIGRGEQTMASPEGKALMARAGIPETWICKGFVLLGYGAGETGEGRPRNYERIHREV